MIMFDGNAWAWPDIIKGDPHKQNKNGTLLANFLIRNSNMHLLNASSICQGLVTQSRKVGGRNEISAIDFVIVCR